MFIPEKSHKQNLPPYQHIVCAPIWTISHTVSTSLHCSLQRNDRYRTHNPCLVTLLLSKYQRKEPLGQCPNLMEWQTELDPGKQLSPSFWRTKKSIRRNPTCFGFSGLFTFLFLCCSKKVPVRWTCYFFCCFVTRIFCRFRLGTGLKSGIWY